MGPDPGQVPGAAPDPVAGPAAHSRRRRLLRRSLGWALLLVLVVALALSLRSQYSSVRADVARLAWWRLAAAVVLSVSAVGAAMGAWRSVLGALGSPLPLPAAVRIYSISQLGKYVPGSVWPVVAQMHLARAYGVPRARSATAFLLALLVSLLTAAATGGLVALSIDGWGRLLALCPLLLLLLHPRLLRPLTALAARLTRRPVISEPPSGAGIVRALGWMVVQWLLLGAASELIAAGLGGSVPLSMMVGAVALAWGVGLVVIVVPAGAGVRESVLVLLLAGHLDTGRAVVLALLARLALTAADGCWALGALLVRRGIEHMDEMTDLDGAATPAS